jgi:hypothetical protein
MDRLSHHHHHLCYFWAVVRHGSLNLASFRLRLAPSTISSQPGKREEILAEILDPPIWDVWFSD